MDCDVGPTLPPPPNLLLPSRGTPNHAMESRSPSLNPSAPSYLLRRLTELSKFRTSAVPSSSRDSKTYIHLAPLLRPADALPLTFSILREVLEACFGDGPTAQADTIESGFDGLNMVCSAFGRLESYAGRSGGVEVDSESIERDTWILKLSQAALKAS